MTRRRTECTLFQRLKLKRLAEELLSDADGLEFVLLSLVTWRRCYASSLTARPYESWLTLVLQQVRCAVHVGASYRACAVVRNECPRWQRTRLSLQAHATRSRTQNTTQNARTEARVYPGSGRTGTASEA